MLDLWKQDCKAIIPTLCINNTFMSLFDWTHISHFVTSRVLSQISGGWTFVTKETGGLSILTMCHSERRFKLLQIYACFKWIFFSYSNIVFMIENDHFIEEMILNSHTGCVSVFSFICFRFQIEQIKSKLKV